MPTSEGPLNKAHQHASNAEDYLNQGLLIPAAEEHYKSAEAFMQCVEQAGDEGTKRTLRMLYNEHSKSGKELQRKIVKIKEEGRDPSLPQISHTPIPAEPIYAPHSLSSASPAPFSYINPRGRLSDSSHTIDESYMVLGQQSDHTFNEFWKVFEGMLDNLSQPVAFATAPLPRPKSAGSTHSQFEISDSSPNKRAFRRDETSNSDETNIRAGLISKYNGRTLGLGEPRQEENLHSHSVGSRAVILDDLDAPDNSDIEEVLADPDSPSGESFFVIPSTSGPSTTRLQRENASLKHEIESLRQRLDIAERMRVGQEQQIREGISQARREAQRVMNSSYLPQRPLQSPVDLSALNLNNPPAFTGPMGSRDREGQLTRRIKDLEEEVKTLRIENEKHKAMIVKFRERWEKLKESAKRKRNAKVNAGLESVREQRIDEEPEAEAEAEPQPVITG